MAEPADDVRLGNRKENMSRGRLGGCFSPNQKPGSGKSILRFAIEAIASHCTVQYCSVKSNKGTYDFREESTRGNY
jgi:hypothetical protein